MTPPYPEAPKEKLPQTHKEETSRPTAEEGTLLPAP